MRHRSCTCLRGDEDPAGRHRTSRYGRALFMISAISREERGREREERESLPPSTALLLVEHLPRSLLIFCLFCTYASLVRFGTDTLAAVKRKAFMAPAEKPSAFEDPGQTRIRIDTHRRLCTGLRLYPRRSRRCVRLGSILTALAPVALP